MSAITGLPLPEVHKAIEYRLIRSKRVQEGRVVHRMLSKSQAVYLRMEGKGLRSLPLATRRQVAQAVERDPAIDVMAVSEGRVILIQFKSARKEVDTGLRRLTQAIRMVESDPAIMHGTPVYRRTRIPVESVPYMLWQGATIAEILDGYPALSREKVELAPMYVRVFPRRGRPAIRPWGESYAAPSQRTLVELMKFLIDECLHTPLIALAHEAGHVCDHVNFLGLGGQKDWQFAYH